jgi:Flp pilus assembly protein TadG
LPQKRNIFSCEAGVSAVELAIVLSVFLMFMFGVVKIGLLLWTQSGLHYATEAAARCASVDGTNCGAPAATSARVTTYALSHYFGQPLGATNPFTYSATGCGHTVAAAYTYSLVIPFAGTYSVPLSATACFP